MRYGVFAVAVVTTLLGAALAAAEPIHQIRLVATPGASSTASPLASPVASPAVGQTFLVTSNADAGLGSLRQAILDANALPGLDSIQFQIASRGDAGGIVTIAVQSLLPPVTGPLALDGTTQPGYSPAHGPVVEISGAGLTKTCAGAELGLYRDFPGLDLVRLPAASADASGATIRGLAFSQFCQAISISSAVAEPQADCEGTDEPIGDIVVEANLFRQNHGGNAALDLCGAEDSVLHDNRFVDNGDHIEITRSRGILVADNESGAALDSSIELINSHEITIQGNRLRGDRAAGGDRSGIVLAFGSADSRILDNEISDMATAGLFLGDTSEVRGNVITGSGWYGIDVLGGSGNHVVGNWVRGNALGGIAVHAGVLNFLDECAVVAGTPRDCGVVAPLFGGAARDNVISENVIADNGGSGVLIGGVYTDPDGIRQVAAGNSVVANMFAGNGGLAIDLSDRTGSLFFPVIEPLVGAYGEVIVALPDGPTPNEEPLLANAGQDAPVLRQRSSGLGENPGDIHFEGELRSKPAARVLIEVYACGADPVSQSAHGRARLLTMVVQTDAAGRADFLIVAPAAPVLDAAPVRGCLTATATALRGPEDTIGDTSEFGAPASGDRSSMCSECGPRWDTTTEF